MPTWEAGTQIRLKNDPGMIGICTGRTKERAGSLQVQVTFPVLGTTYQSAKELELLTDSSTDPDDWMAEGRFGRVPDLRRHLTHIQLAGRLANLIYSMETTHTEFYAHQYIPVLAFLESPANGLLITDEVGLGKTIEAGLIWTELRARYEARRLLVVCPAMLRDKWQRELAQRFGVEADILGAEEVRKALQRPRADWPDGRAIIASFQGLRPPREWQKLIEETPNASHNLALAAFLAECAEQEPLVDLLVVDEAHYLRNAHSLTAKLGHLLRGVAEHIVLLTATPINIHDTDLFNLLNLVDPDNFQYSELFSQVLDANEPLIKARQFALDRTTGAEIIGSLLRKAKEHMLLRHNYQLAQLIEHLPTIDLNDTTARNQLADRIERANLFNNVITRTRKRDITARRVTRRAKIHKASMHPAEAKFYKTVTDAIRVYAHTCNINEGFLLAQPQRQVSSCMAAAVRAWRCRAGFGNEDNLLYEDFGYEPDDDKQSPLIDALIHEALPTVDLRILEQYDSKYDLLRTVLTNYFEENPQEKIVVFSYFRETLTYLGERLVQDGFSHQILVGGMENKQDAIERFRDNPDIRILLSSEVASEGVDLQFCRVLINYDLPWNPMRVEQRIGRLDRLGQMADVILILNLCYAETIDERILVRLYERLNLFERALGSMEAIIGERIQSLAHDLLANQLTPEEEEHRIEQTAIALDNQQRLGENLEQKASSLIAHGGYILEQVQAIHEFSRRITDRDLLIFVRDYLDRHAPGYELRQPETDPLELELKLPAGLATRFDDYLRQQKLHSQTRLAKGELVRCRFINKVANRRGTEPDEPELISQFHPLPRFISQDLQRRQDVFPPVIAARLAVQHLKAQISPGHYAFAIDRWSFSGLRTEEELQARTTPLEDITQLLSAESAFDLINAIRLNGEDWLEAPTLCTPIQVQAGVDQCLEVLLQDFEAARDHKTSENLDRIAFQRQSLEKHRDRKMTKFQETLQGHEAAGRKGLAQATRANIRNLENKVAIKLAQFVEKERMDSSHFTVCVGVVQVD